MKISLSWLKKYIDFKMPPQKLVEKLTSAGLEVGQITKMRSNFVFDIEITSNRPDWLSYLGIAREVAALSNIKKINRPKALPLKMKASIKKPFTIDIKDNKACSRYVGRLIRDVKIGKTDQWMINDLDALGSRTINNAADITNYCLFETGQPLHVFDFDKIEGAKIIVRKAKKGESIVTIDGVKRELDESILVIADAVKPIAIAGIMGGLDTEVTDKTKNILLESAFFDPVTIRRASRKLALRTESNYRFERKVDSENVLFASCRAAYLLKDMCKGNTDEPFVDINYLKSGTRIIQFDLSNFERLIGIKITALRAKSVLNSLGFTVKPGKGKDVLSVTVPSFRDDVSLEEDLVEEISRIEGFDKIKDKMPPIMAHVDSAYTDTYLTKNKIRTLLLGRGISEIITITLMSNRVLDDALTSKDNRAIVINPLSSEQEVLRNSLLAPALKVINSNLNRKINQIKLFEIGNIYEKHKNKFIENEFLSIAFVGDAVRNWQEKNRKINFYDIKGIVETILSSFGINGYVVKRNGSDYLESAKAASVFFNDVCLAEFGKINKTVLKNFDISEQVYFAQININEICKNKNEEYRFISIPKFPSVVRDIALVIKKDIQAKKAIEIVKDIAGEMAINIEIFDVYTGDQVPEDSKSLAFSIEYQNPKSTLTEEQVNKIHSKVQNKLISDLGGSLR